MKTRLVIVCLKLAVRGIEKGWNYSASDLIEAVVSYLEGRSNHMDLTDACNKAERLIL